MLQRGEIDVIAADLTQTWPRGAVVDFTKAFFATELTLLLKDPEEPFSPWWRWVSPLSWPVWLITLLSYLVSLFCLWLCTRLTPRERKLPPSIGDLACRLAAPWLVWPHTWSPRSCSSRLVTVTWSLTHLVLLLLYLLHLPPHLTPTPAPRLNTVDQVLAEGAQYVMIGGGSTQQLLRNSVNPTHQSLWASSIIVPNISTALERVDEGDTMVLERAGADYLTSEDCSLYSVGSLEDRQYSFAVKKGSRYRRILSEGLLNITAQGKLSAAKERWWRTPSCPPTLPSTSLSPPVSLTLYQLYPLFILFLIFLLLSLLLLLLEYLRDLKQRGNLSKCPSICCNLLCQGSQEHTIPDLAYTPLPRKNEATQTVLWSSSRGTSPQLSHQNSHQATHLSHRLYYEDTGNPVGV